MSNEAFAVEEYKCKWVYICHTEDSPQKVVQWYLGMVGGLLAFLVKDKGSENETPVTF